MATILSFENIDDAVGQDWFARASAQIELERKTRKAEKHVKTVSFNRTKFVENVQTQTSVHPHEGFVIGLKRRREFATDFCIEYKQFTSAQCRELLLALAEELGSHDIPIALEEIPLFMRAKILFAISAPSIAFERFIDTSLVQELKELLQPPSAKFVKLVASVPQGARFLLDLRGELVRLLEDKGDKAVLTKQQRKSLESLNDTMRELFHTQQGVQVRQVTLEHESVLQFIVQNERVHRYIDWMDLRRRITGKGRLLFALFHANIYVPLCFVTIVMTCGYSCNIQQILRGSEEVPERPTHAIFYAISNPHQGLQGLNLASHLLFLSIGKIKEQYPTTQIFATLSPVPGFREWLVSKLMAKDDTLFTATQKAWLVNTRQNPSVFDIVLNIIQEEEWNKVMNVCPAELEEILMQLCSRYLLFERRGRKIFDPVANFHISNGAQVEKVNFAADCSRKGRLESLGIMVNYKYDLDSIDVAAQTFHKFSTVSAPKLAVMMLQRVNSPVFKVIGREKFESFNAPLYARVYNPRQKIIKRGSLSTAVYVISMGTAKIHGIKTTILKNGDYFGEVEILLDEPRRYDVTAETECHVFMLLRADFEKILAANPDLAAKARILAADSSAPRSKM